MSIPPLLSSTPPPLEETGSMRDHDSDFGEFSDHASVGAVSSTTSIPDSSSVFRPVDTSKLSAGLHETDTNLKLDGLPEGDDEWSEFDSVVVEQASEAVHTDSADFIKDEKLVADTSASGSTIELSTLSASQAIISEQGDVSWGFSADAEVECNDRNSPCEAVSSVGKFDSGLHESVNTVSDCKMAEISHSVDDDSEVSDSASDNENLEYHNAVDSAEQEDETEDNNSLQASSAGTVSDTNEYGYAADNEPASDENDFVDDYQSFSNDTDTHQDSMLDVEAQRNMPEDSDFISYKDEEEASSCIEASAVISSALADSLPVDISCNAALSSSVVKDSPSTAVAKDDQVLTHEQTLASNEEVNDDFADFEEFVSAKEGPTEGQPVADSGTYHWNAFEDTVAADDDDWAAFQDSGQTVSAVSASEVSDSNVAFIQQPVMTYSDQLSKVHNF